MKRIAIIGASKGIGKALANDLVDSHFIESISRSVPQLPSSNFRHHSCDILAEELPELEALDGLVYCPGSINLKPFSRLSLDDFRADFEINVLGAVKAIQQYIPALKKGKNPSIVLFSTVACKLGMPYHASIASSKSAVEGLVKTLGAELAPTIRINGIAPTITDTELASKLLRNEKMVESIKERHPLKKFLDPEEVASMAAYLLSDKSKSISGQIFELDCGIVSFKI